jgi:hypothetical protein
MISCFLFNKIREEEETGSAWKQEVGGVGGLGDVAQTMYTYVSKYKKDKIKREKKLNSFGFRFLKKASLIS